jgi:hypothetical protein
MLIEGFCRDQPGRLEVSRGRTFGFIRRHRWMVRFWHPICLVWYIRGRVMSQDRVEAGFVTVQRAELCASQYFLR